MITPDLSHSLRVDGEIQRLENMGVTDFNAAVVDVEEGARTRTLEFLASLTG